MRKCTKPACSFTKICYIRQSAFFPIFAVCIFGCFYFQFDILPLTVKIKFTIFCKKRINSPVTIDKNMWFFYNKSV